MKGDPFRTRTLEDKDDFQELFVKTSSVLKEIDPMIEHSLDSAPKIVVISGERRIGKTTTVHYIREELARDGTIITAYVPLDKGKIRNFEHN